MAEENNGKPGRLPGFFEDYGVGENGGGLVILNRPAGYDEVVNKKYKLLGPDGKVYTSDVPGTLGGNSNLKIYGRLDCSSALNTIRRFPGSYEKCRVFFADEKAALAAGYRPCGRCLHQKYKEYMADPEKYRAKFGL